MASAGMGTPTVGLRDPFAPSDTDTASSPEAITCQNFRRLVQSAISQQQFKLASFYADKLVSLSHGDETDIMLQCRVYFLTAEYSRALHVMESRGLCSSPEPQHLQFRALTAQCLVALSRWDQVLEALEAFLEPYESTQGIMQLACQYPHVQGASVNVVSTLCTLCARAYLQLDNATKACLWFKNALCADVYNAEAFGYLVDSQLLSAVEEAQLLEALPFHASDVLIKEMYSVRLNKYDATRTVTAAFEKLDSVSSLATNPDLMAAKAEACYYQCDVTTAYQLSKIVASVDPFHTLNCIVRLSSLVTLNKAPELYKMAHSLVDAQPEDPLSFYAIGCYYMCVNRPALARRYFNKATTAQPRFAQAWLGLGNACASLDETDHAMNAYRTSFRLFPGSHLPLVCMAMESQRQKNATLAEQYLNQARSMCPWDPLVLNELGVLKYREQDFVAATPLLEEVLDLIRELPMMQRVAWEPTLLNLGHCYRKTGLFDKAIEMYDACLALMPQQSATLSALGFTWHLKGNLDKAVDYYHKAVGVSPDDTFSQQLLRRALSELIGVSIDVLIPADSDMTRSVAGTPGRPSMRADASSHPPPRAPGGHSSIREFDPPTRTPGVPSFLLQTPTMLQFTPGPSKTPASAVFVDMPRSTGDMSGRSSQFLTPDAIETSPIMADSSGFFDAQDSSAFEAMDTDD